MLYNDTALYCCYIRRTRTQHIIRPSVGNYRYFSTNILYLNNIACRYEDTLDLPDINYAFDNGNEKDWILDPANATKFGMSPVSYYEAINVRPILLKPKSRGYILLNKTHPVWGQPLIYPRFFTKGNDLDILVEGNVNIIRNNIN